MRLEYIKDITDNNYIGINIYSDMVISFLDKMKSILGDDYDEYIKYQQDRDRGHYHCTVVNVMEYNKVVKDMSKVNSINEFINVNDIKDFKLLGLGSVERKGNKAYFVVCASEELKAFRKSLGLEAIDFHVTLGFKYKDVFGLRKNQILPEVQPFLSDLKQYYTSFDQSFNFLKELDFYDYDVSKDIYCVKLLPSYAEFRVGNEEGVSDYFTISLIANKLTISCRWQNSDAIPYLANTVILRKLN